MSTEGEHLRLIEERLNGIEEQLQAIRGWAKSTTKLLSKTTDLALKINAKMATREQVKGLQGDLEKFRAEWKRDISQERPWLLP